MYKECVDVLQYPHNGNTMGLVLLEQNTDILVIQRCCCSVPLLERQCALELIVNKHLSK